MRVVTISETPRCNVFSSHMKWSAGKLLYFPSIKSCLKISYTHIFVFSSISKRQFFFVAHICQIYSKDRCIYESILNYSHDCWKKSCWFLSFFFFFVLKNNPLLMFWKMNNERKNKKLLSWGNDKRGFSDLSSFTAYGIRFELRSVLS